MNDEKPTTPNANYAQEQAGYVNMAETALEHDQSDAVDQGIKYGDVRDEWKRQADEFGEYCDFMDRAIIHEIALVSRMYHGLETVTPTPTPHEYIRLIHVILSQRLGTLETRSPEMCAVVNINDICAECVEMSVTDTTTLETALERVFDEISGYYTINPTLPDPSCWLDARDQR